MITNPNIDQGRAFDWGKASEDYARFRDIYPQLFYDKIIEAGLCLAGQTVLDLGTGTGVLPRNLYKYGANFIGTDISENQITQARRLSAEKNQAIDYLVTSAEEISFPEKSFDVITACQCFMYFDQKILLPKIYKLLKDDGQFCILFLAWLPAESEIAKTSEELVLKYNPTWTGAGMQRSSLETPEWSKELFQVRRMENFDIPLTFTRENWHGRMKACRGIGASALSTAEIAAWEKEHLAYLERIPETFEILHTASLASFEKKL